MLLEERQRQHGVDALSTLTKAYTLILFDSDTFSELLIFLFLIPHLFPDSLDIRRQRFFGKDILIPFTSLF